MKEKWGILAGNTGWFKMSDVEVPEANVLGQVGEGFKIAMFALDQGRYTVAAGATGLIRACRDASVKYAHERKTFGVEIGEHQLVKEMIAQMESDYQSARLLWLRSGWMKNHGMRNTRETGLAKWFATVASRTRRRRCGADPRRQRLFRRVPGRTVLPELQRRGDLRRAPARSTRSCRPITCSAIEPTGRRAVSCRRTERKSKSESRAFRTTPVAEWGRLQTSNFRLHTSGNPWTPIFHSSSLRVVEQAAIACAHTMGQGDRHHSDHVAVEAMRKVMDSVPIDGTIVIGEGERDEAPMLYIGEKVGMAHALGKGAAGAISASRHRRRSARRHQPVRHRRGERDRRAGGIEQRRACCTRPICTWRSWSSARARRTRSASTLPVHENLKAIARLSWAHVEDLVVIVLDRAAAREIDRRHPRDRRADPPDRRRRPLGRHCGRGRRLGRACGDGHGRRARGRPDRGRDALPERRDIRAAGGQQAGARRALPGDGHQATSRRSIDSKDLAPGERVIFAATGVTDGTLMRGVRFFGDGIRTSSVIMQNEPHRIRFIDSIHVDPSADVRIRF